MSVVHPPHLSASPSKAAPGTAAAQREAVKLSSEGAHECPRRHQKFTPGAAETTETWGPAAQRCVRGLAHKQSMRLGEALGTVARRLWWRLSAAEEETLRVPSCLSASLQCLVALSVAFPSWSVNTWFHDERSRVHAHLHSRPKPTNARDVYFNRC